MVDCEARVPLMVFAKLHGINVKDPVDLAIVRPGRLIHAVFERVATKLSAEGRITDAVAVKNELEAKIAVTVPEMDAADARLHAAKLASAMHETTIAEPSAEIAHERSVSVSLSATVKLSGRIDTIVGDASGWVIIERKTGELCEWHVKQVQLYAEMLVAKQRDSRIARLELWYSRYGKKVVPCTSGELLRGLRADACRGEGLGEGDAGRIVEDKCVTCPRIDCGVKRLGWELGLV